VEDLVKHLEVVPQVLVALVVVPHLRILVQVLVLEHQDRVTLVEQVVQFIKVAAEAEVMALSERIMSWVLRLETVVLDLVFQHLLVAQ
jgi:hypothetical protein